MSREIQGGRDFSRRFSAGDAPQAFLLARAQRDAFLQRFPQRDPPLRHRMTTLARVCQRYPILVQTHLWSLPAKINGKAFWNWPTTLAGRSSLQSGTAHKHPEGKPHGKKR